MSGASSPIDRLLALGGELTTPAAGAPRRKFDLEHMRALLRALGDPQLRFPSVLIAGTNGKGSTAATLASILQAAGHRTGLYTSPHLELPNERIRVNDAAISDQALSSRFEQVDSASARLVSTGELPHSPSFFETITAIAFLHFAGAAFTEVRDAPGCVSDNAISPPPVEIAVLEVGLGGRLDATNVVDPLVSVLTDISLDHTEWLGNTISAITREKCGILRSGGTLVTLPQHPEANQTIGEIAVPLQIKAVNAAEYLPQNFSGGRGSGESSLRDAFRNRYTLSLPANTFGGVNLQVDSPLAGQHQQRNMALAISAAVVLHQQHGFTLTPEAIEAGICDTHWPGRLELFMPPPGGAHKASILLDAAHNPAGAWALRAAISALPLQRGTRVLVFGCMADKAVDELAQILFPVFDQVRLTRTDSPRSASLQQLASAAEQTGAAYRTYPVSTEALLAAQSLPDAGLVVVAGSISLLGELRRCLPEWR